MALPQAYRSIHSLNLTLSPAKSGRSEGSQRCFQHIHNANYYYHYFLNQTKTVEVAGEGHFHVNASRIFEEYSAWLPKTASGIE